MHLWKNQSLVVPINLSYILNMNIGKLQITSPLLLAPMAGYTDSPFRQLCKESGADIVYAEFVSSEGIIRGSEKTYEYLTFKHV